MKRSKIEEAYLKIILECGDGEVQTENEEVVPQEKQSKKVAFITSNQDLIDVLNGSFEEVVFFVKSEDEDGEESWEELKFSSDEFGVLTVEDEAKPTDDPDGNEFSEGTIGAGAGAAGGAAIGSLIAPGIGTVVGAGLGGVASSMI